jgi:hypothetical protein
MPLFSSSQPSLRARVLSRFPAQVLAGNGITITRNGGTYTFDVQAVLAIQVLHLPNLFDAATDPAAASGGVQIGQLYRTGNDVKVRIV